MDTHTHCLYLQNDDNAPFEESASTSSACLHMFQISTNAIPARASMERVATWPGPSTASAPMAASWTPPTPSAWVRHPPSHFSWARQGPKNYSGWWLLTGNNWWWSLSVIILIGLLSPLVNKHSGCEGFQEPSRYIIIFRCWQRGAHIMY